MNSNPKMVVASIGEITITAVTDGEAPPVDPSWPFPKVPPGLWKQHQYALDAKGLHKSNFGSFIIQVKDDIMLVDTGLGPHPPKKYGIPPAKLPESIKNAGFSLQDINVVFFTHLHFDHVGWALTHDRSSPFFPNAQYIASKIDWSYWKSCEDTSRKDHTDAFKDRVQPLANFGTVELIEGETTLIPGIRTLPTPGHTPGHMSLLLESNGANGIVTGDVFHSPVQFTEPDWSHRADVDEVEARRSRKFILEQLVPGITIAAGHLEHTSNIGTVANIERKRYWQSF